MAKTKTGPKKESVKIRKLNMSRKLQPCPRCKTYAVRRSNNTRRLREIGISGPTIVEVTLSKHYCPQCKKYFSLPIDHLAPPFSRFTNRVRRTAVDLVIKQALTLHQTTQRMRQKYYVNVPASTLYNWVIAELMLA